MHQALKGRWCVAESERHNTPFEAAVATVECRFMLIGLAHHDLVVTVSQIQLREASRSLKSTQQLVNAGYRKAIRYRLGIKPAVIYTHTETSILLLREEDGGPVWGC